MRISDWSSDVCSSDLLGRWSEVRLQISHDFAQPLNVEVFDHVPDGLDFENLPLSVELQSGQHSQIGYRLRPLKRGHFSFEHCEISLPSPLGLWAGKRLDRKSTRLNSSH